MDETIKDLVEKLKEDIKECFHYAPEDNESYDDNQEEIDKAEATLEKLVKELLNRKVLKEVELKCKID